MVETVQWRRKISKLRTRGSGLSGARSDDFTVILILSLSGIAVSLFAIGQGWLGDPEYLSRLFLQFQ